MIESKELAEAHWEYIHNTLDAHGIDDELLKLIGYHYKTAFVHGFKHGCESKESMIVPGTLFRSHSIDWPT